MAYGFPYLKSLSIEAFKELPEIRDIYRSDQFSAQADKGKCPSLYVDNKIF